jgi:hypothetical protein
MHRQNADLDEFNTAKVLRIIWETFADCARSPAARSSATYFSLVGIGENYSICNDAFKRCKTDGLVPQNVRNDDYAPFRHVVLKVYNAALGMGLVLPSRLSESLNWNPSNGVFHFTSEGITYFSGGFISVDDSGYFGQALAELQGRIPLIGDGQRELLLEAHRCLKANCYRAAMVLIGVANEDACLALANAVPANLKAPPNGNPLLRDWNTCCDVTLTLSHRWKSAVRILESVKSKLRKVVKGEPWWQWWEMVPGSLYTVGEAVRIARNAAAHSVDRTFSKAEVALLLASMPTQIEMIGNLTAFLTDPPIDLSSVEL